MDATGLGRNVTIEVLEYFDLLGFTDRDGDTRIIIGDGDRFFATRKRIQAWRLSMIWTPRLRLTNVLKEESRPWSGARSSKPVKGV